MFRRFFNSISRFMVGRNGFDYICRFLLGGYFAVWLITYIATKISRSITVYYVGEAILAVIIAYAVFRVLSRNVSARRYECEKWQKFVGRFVKDKGNRYDPNCYAQYNEYKPTKPKYKSTKEIKYITCKNCGAVLRLKRKRGRHTVECPKCKNEIKVFSLFGK